MFSLHLHSMKVRRYAYSDMDKVGNILWKLTECHS